jgi:hypothetical protein
MDIAYPFRINSKGRTDTAGYEKHIRGLMQLTFNNLSDEVASTIQFMVQGSLQHWLGNLIQVESVEAKNAGSSLQVTVQYVLRRSQERKIASFLYEV